jgi:hypothetical protein
MLLQVIAFCKFFKIAKKREMAKDKKEKDKEKDKDKDKKDKKEGKDKERYFSMS